MQQLKNFALSDDNTPYVITLGLRQYILDKYDEACARIESDIPYKRPHVTTEHPSYFLLSGIQALLQCLSCICAIQRSPKGGPDFQALIVTRSASGSIFHELS